MRSLQREREGGWDRKRERQGGRKGERGGGELSLHREQLSAKQPSKSTNACIVCVRACVCVCARVYGQYHLVLTIL